MVEIRKNLFNRRDYQGIYFLRDSSDNEIDLVLEKNGEPMAIEIKASANAVHQLPKNLRYWQKISPGKTGLLIHGGSTCTELAPTTNSLGWKSIGDL